MEFKTLQLHHNPCARFTIFFSMQCDFFFFFKCMHAMQLCFMHVMRRGPALHPNDWLTLHNNDSCSRNSNTCSMSNRNLLETHSNGLLPKLSLREKRNATHSTSPAWFSPTRGFELLLHPSALG